MTGNKSYLSYYEEIDGVFVAFGGSTKGGKINGKGKISTGKLDFEDMYFVKELKFNLFSVSQMCDKKNNVLFTDTESLRRRAVDCTPDLQGQGNSSVAWSGNDRSRPEWIFDIDTLTKSMNYKLVVAGNQTNGNAGTKESIDAGQAGKKTVPREEEKKHAGDQENEDSEVQNTEEPRFEDNAVDKNIVYGCEDDPNMPNLKEIVYSEDVDGVGFEDPEFPDRVYKVEKALYVLNQAPRAWYETLSTYLLDNGFQRGTIDKTLFIKKVKVTQKDNGIYISQDQYVDEILKKFGFLTVKTASTSMETSKPLMKDEKVKDVNVYLYRSMIGSLMYLTSSRPNIMFVVCACARFQVTPKVSHLHAVKRIFRYLKGQPKLGLWYPKDSPFDLEAYTDGDYAGASLDRKSTTEVKNPVFHSKTKHIEIRHHFIRDSYEKILIQVIKIHTSHNVADLLIKAFDGNPQLELQEKGVIDSGCSRHMTGNKSYLSNYEEIDGGFVAFGGSTKGGKITGKGKIRTGKLDFEDVYFVKELKFNLFSVSQMCDKKNSVLFTDTECVVLSPDFKLLDENQVLLRVPRKNNMYSVDLKNVAPSGGLTCLFAKATLDESNLWHRRLGHINFKTMNKLMKGNLVRGLPSKNFENDHTCVACQKGKQHKASCKTKTNKEMNQFCEMKGIKREFSVARTPQQNGVAERKNITLIEAAKTMLADSKLPTTFWAEAVNTACYVQNRWIYRAYPLMGWLMRSMDIFILNDLLLSSEDRLKLNELMELCTNLSQRVLNWENTKTFQAVEIAKLKEMVKKLERTNKSRTPSLKRLRKEDASKQGRKITDIDADAKVTLVDEAQEGNDDNLMFDTEVFDEHEVEVEKAVSTDEVTSASVTPTTVDELTLAKTLIEIKAAKPKAITTAATTTTTAVSRPKARGVDNTQAMMEADYELTQRLQAEEQGELTIEERSKLFVELMDKRKKHFAKLRAEEIRRKPPTKAQKRNQMCTYLKNMANYKHSQLKNTSFEEIQMLFDNTMKWVYSFVLMDSEVMKGSKSQAEGSYKRTGEELESDNSKNQKIDENVEAEVDDEAEMKKHMEIVHDDEVAIDAIPLATKPPVILVKATHGNTRPEEAYERVLWGDLKVMFELDVEKKKYPLTPATITKMLNKKLQADQWNEICYQLLKLMTKQCKNPGSV
ncbi:ribonuclease H-like domain-containing protein [Tanacetum coccineum]